MKIKTFMLVFAASSAFIAAPVSAYNDCECAFRCMAIADEDARNQCFNACAMGSGDPCQPGPNP